MLLLIPVSPPTVNLSYEAALRAFSLSFRSRFASFLVMLMTSRPL